MSNGDVNKDRLAAARYRGSSNFVSGKLNQDRVQELVKKAQEVALQQRANQKADSAAEKIEDENSEGKVDVDKNSESDKKIEVEENSDKKEDIEEKVDSDKKVESNEELPLIEDAEVNKVKEAEDSGKSETEDGEKSDTEDGEKSETEDGGKLETEAPQPTTNSHEVLAEDIEDVPTKVGKPRPRRVAFLESHKGDECSSERSFGTGGCPPTECSSYHSSSS